MDRFNQELMNCEVKAAELATDFAKACEGATQNFSAALCEEAQFIYSRIERITGLICDLRLEIFPDGNYDHLPEGTVIKEIDIS